MLDPSDLCNVAYLWYVSRLSTSTRSTKRESPCPVVFCHPGIHMGPLGKVSDDARNWAILQSIECRMAFEVIEKRLYAVKQAIAVCLETRMDR